LVLSRHFLTQTFEPGMSDFKALGIGMLEHW